jgi:hypothetical protein
VVSKRFALGFHQSTLTDPMSIGAKSGAVSADLIISSTAAKRPIASASLATYPSVGWMRMSLRARMPAFVSR